MGRLPEDIKIDPDSKRLIAKVSFNFKARAIQLRIAFMIVQEFMAWFSAQDTIVLRDKLVNKMTKGAIEHGQSSPEEAQTELEEEYLDLFGWTLKRDL